MAQFHDYSPYIFANIRMLFGITYEKYMESLSPDVISKSLIHGQVAALEALSTEGKSGGIFFYSFDGEFMLKTIHKDEFKLLKVILEDYYYHLQSNPRSLLMKICGLHKILFKPKKDKKYFVIMKNVFAGAPEIHEKFDLKGSTFKRTNTKKKYQQPPPNSLDFDRFPFQLLHHLSCGLFHGPCLLETE